MSDSDQRIREMVRSAMEADPAIKNRVLLDRARQIDADAVDGLSLRQFHARFRLPVTRTLSGGSSRTKPRKRASRPRRKQESLPGQAKRDAIRDVFRRFAVQLAHAESRSEIVRAVARIDEFVEDVVRALAAGGDEPDTRAARRSRSVARASAGEGEERRDEATTAADLPATPVPDRATSAPSPATPVPGRTTSGPSPATPAPGPTPAARAGEPGMRDMARRRRPKGLKSTAEADAAPSDETSSHPSEGAPPPPELPAEEPARPPERAGFSLSHDLEEFRRRRADRERTRPMR